MKIMTFNIQHCLDYKNSVINADLFVNAIKKCGADVCGLNEVRGEGPLDGYTDQTEAIGKGLNFHRYFGEAIKVGGTSPYGNAIVSRYPLISAETVLIPDPIIKTEKVNYESRCIIKAVAEIEGKEICFLVCHMGLANSERKNAVKAVCKLLDEIDIPVILMGDFNAKPDDKVFEPIYSRLNDTDRLNENKELPTFPSYAPEIKIDYIFYRGLECVLVKTVEEVYSDHYPIIAEFR